MVQYRRNFIPGGTFFFAVTLEDRASSLLVEHVGLLRDAFRATRAKKPFTVDAIVILPEHLHTVMTLPRGDADFSDRWRQIKSHFTRSVVAAGVPLSANHRGEYPLWQRRFWEHTIRNEHDLERRIGLHPPQSCQAPAGLLACRLATHVPSPIHPGWDIAG
ncbi:transposase [Bradyrhizobium sp. B124]|uniref:REP-associated tyrosine transposase n=1 Tax=Bradyrhizobium sp. B124 TaxID=3140245 RepID=UPI0031840BF5